MKCECRVVPLSVGSIKQVNISIILTRVAFDIYVKANVRFAGTSWHIAAQMTETAIGYPNPYPDCRRQASVFSRTEPDTSRDTFEHKGRTLNVIRSYRVAC